MRVGKISCLSEICNPRRVKTFFLEDKLRSKSTGTFIRLNQHASLTSINVAHETNKCLFSAKIGCSVFELFQLGLQQPLQPYWQPGIARLCQNLFLRFTASLFYLEKLLEIGFVEEMRTVCFFDTSFFSYHEKATMALSYGRIRTRLGVDHFPDFQVDFIFPHKFAGCLEPSSRGKAYYPRRQQRN